MAVIQYNQAQIKELESNKYVEKCTSKQIRFINECKIEVLKINYENITWTIMLLIEYETEKKHK